jgi:hypothetical protein
MSELKTARLLCSTSRMASVPFIKSLPFERCPDCEDSLTRCLGVFPFVTSIALSIQLPQHVTKANLIDLSTVRSKLCKLRFYLPPKCAPLAAALEANHSLEDMITNLSLAPQLTSLELHTWPEFKGRTVHEIPCYQLLDVLRVCKALRELTLGVDLPYLGGLTHEALLGLTSLRTLHVTPNGLFPWGKFLENSFRLTHLSCLDTMLITDHALILEDDDVEDGVMDLNRTFAYVNDIVKLTQLTSLEAFCQPAQNCLPFSKLTALEVLRLDCLRCLPFKGTLQMIISKMSKLRELELHCRASSTVQIRDLDNLVASVSELTRLQLKTVRCVWSNRHYPMEAFRQDGIAGLRDISLRLSPKVASQAFSRLQACYAWTRLERLELEFPTAAGLPGITRWDVMPSVTQLILEAPRKFIYPRVDLRSASASFLSKFPQLQHLQLHFVLDARRMDDDIAYLAALTKLTYLELHLLDIHREPEFGAPLSELGTSLQQLSALRKLEKVVLTGSGQVLQYAEGLYGSLRSVRKQMGLLPTRFSLRRFTGYPAAKRAREN